MSVNSLWAVLPETLLFLGIVFSMVAGLCPSYARRSSWIVSGILLLSALALYLQLSHDLASSQTEFFGHYKQSFFTAGMKLVCVGLVWLGLIYAQPYLSKRKNIPLAEFHLLVLFSLLGQMVVISANHLLVAYLGLELMSLPLYALCALRRRDVAGGEAAMKYFVLGVLSSGFLLYGFSILYGTVGSLNIETVATKLSWWYGDRLMVTGALVFILAALIFKFGAAPFHMWVPDVYEGAPVSAVLFIAGPSKVAVFSLGYALLSEMLPTLSVDWHQMLMWVSVFSAVIGNILACSQKNLKRLLAYSAVAQVGFFLIPFSSHPGGMVPALFYALSYVMTVVGIFGWLQQACSAEKEISLIDDLRGIYSRHPLLSLVFILFLLSLAGLPPFLGFQAKFLVLRELLVAKQLGIAVLLVITSVIGAFYYLRVIKAICFDAPESVPVSVVDPTIQRKAPQPVDQINCLNMGLLATQGMLVLLLGMFPSFLMSLCEKLMRSGVL